MASSKPFLEEAMISVTLATDIGLLLSFFTSARVKLAEESLRRMIASPASEPTDP
jgi:hypothetical protein